MEKLIKKLEYRRRAHKAEEASLTRSWMDAVDSDLIEMAEVYNRVRHFHMAKKETLADVLKMLKELEEA